MYKMASNLVSIRRRNGEGRGAGGGRYEKTPENVSDLGAKTETKLYNSVLELVGNTPLIKLNKLPRDHGVPCEIYAKCEFFNPSGSIKDRIALSVIQDARQAGVVNNDTEFVEASSGNTGIGIALNAAVSENKCIIITEDNSSEEANTINLLGAEVIQAKNKDAIAYRLKDENPDKVVILNQGDNPVNQRTHYENTAEEIVSALGDVDMVVMGTGTGDTMTGIGLKLKERNPKCVVVVAEPDGSVVFNTKDKEHPFLVEGIGGSNLSITIDKSVADHFEVVTDQESFLMSREMAKKEGLLCGGSSGTAMAAAIKAVKALNVGPGQRVVVILPDGIRNYMSKFVSDQWMEAHRFIEPPAHTMKWWKRPITDIYLRRSYPKLNKDSTCVHALRAMNTHNVNLAVIVDDLGGFVGVVTKDNLRNRATNPTKLPGQDSENFDFEGAVFDNLDRHVFTLAEKSEAGHPTVGLLSRMLDITPFVIIVNKGTSDENDFFIPTGVVTSDDILDYII
ncbi:hypothetical protein PYW08_007663 [Mythimna loreyi]|uniref:Uncharacterized protein n=1 Tax=Mythimna loreyi TaxID=667449 RepID=A0ACC2QEA4_9NEOP|nr:hypothetical protein PYW08_007663 [Mythimna loreyi]